MRVDKLKNQKLHNMKHYRPLPDYLRVRESDVEGDGLFATDDIEANCMMGITHVEDAYFPDGYIRTPLGGHFNHSETPNCGLIEEGRFLKLKSIKNIKSGEEITVRYTMYNPTDE